MPHFCRPNAAAEPCNSFGVWDSLMIYMYSEYAERCNIYRDAISRRVNPLHTHIYKYRYKIPHLCRPNAEAAPRGSAQK